MDGSFLASFSWIVALLCFACSLAVDAEALSEIGSFVQTALPVYSVDMFVKQQEAMAAARRVLVSCFRMAVSSYSGEVQHEVLLYHPGHNTGAQVVPVVLDDELQSLLTDDASSGESSVQDAQEKREAFACWFREQHWAQNQSMSPSSSSPIE